MEVREIKSENGTLLRVEFISTGEENFKASVKTWIQNNTTMNWQEFFNRLEEFRLGLCRLNMLEEQP